VVIAFDGVPVPGAQPPVAGAQFAVPSGAGVAPGVVLVGVRFDGVVPAGVPVSELFAPVAVSIPGVVLIPGLVEELIPGGTSVGIPVAVPVGVPAVPVVPGVVPAVPPVAGTLAVVPVAGEPVDCASAANANTPARQAAATVATRCPVGFRVMTYSPLSSLAPAQFCVALHILKNVGPAKEFPGRKGRRGGFSPRLRFAIADKRANRQPLGPGWLGVLPG
jgi:hypothetical protein